jgi:hypothetical protein
VDRTRARRVLRVPISAGSDLPDLSKALAARTAAMPLSNTAIHAGSKIILLLYADALDQRRVHGDMWTGPPNAISLGVGRPPSPYPSGACRVELGERPEDNGDPEGAYVGNRTTYKLRFVH